MCIFRGNNWLEQLEKVKREAVHIPYKEAYYRKKAWQSELRTKYIESGRWNIFYKQAEALQFYREQHTEASQLHEDAATVGFHIFSFEDPWQEGLRQFLVVNLDNFWDFYSRFPDDLKHFYELIPEGLPCKLYFDLEFMTQWYPTLMLRIDELMGYFKEALLEFILEEFNILIDPQAHLVELDSSTQEKFSRHLIVDCPYFFENNLVCGLFVKKFVENFSRFVPSEIYHQLFHVQQPCGSIRNYLREQLFVDQGVYTKNRTFRIVSSKKYGKMKSFSFLTQKCPTEMSDFIRTLICPPNNIFDRSRMKLFPVNYCGSTKHQPKTISEEGFIEACPISLLTRAEDLDSFILWLINQDPYIENPSNPALIKSKSSLIGGLIQYEIKGSRYCDKVQRQHRSNNVVIVVDLVNVTYYRRCFDYECKNLNSPILYHPLPNYFAERISKDDDISDADFLSIDLASFA